MARIPALIANSNEVRRAESAKGMRPLAVGNGAAGVPNFISTNFEILDRIAATRELDRCLLFM